MPFDDSGLDRPRPVDRGHPPRDVDVVATPDPPRTVTPDAYRLDRFESGRSRFVSGVFADVDEAEEAARALERRGYARDDITVFLSTDTRTKQVSARRVYEDHAGHQYVSREPVDLEKGSKALEGLGAGSAIGGAVGAVAAAIAAIGTTLAIPPLGLVVAGPLAAAFAGAGVGGAAGGLVGTLVGAGMSEYRARDIEERVREGAVVLGVRASSETEAEAVEDDLAAHGAEVVREGP